MQNQPFKIGDTVRLKNGSKQMTVRDIRIGQGKVKSTGKTVEKWFIRVQPETQGTSKGAWRLANRYQLWEGYPEMNTRQAQVGDLFKVKGEQTFGTFMATNSKGQYVLEMKGGDGKPAAYDVEAIEEVEPFTIAVRKIINRLPNSTVLNWVAKPGVVKTGQLLIDDEGIRYAVVDTNTKAKLVQKKPENLYLVVTKAISL